MQQRRKGECENQFLRDLEAEGNLALLLIHALIGQPAKKYPVGCVIGVDGHADASGNVKGIAVDTDPLVQGVGDTVRTNPGDQVSGLVAGQVGGDNDKLIAAEAGQGVGEADGAAEIVGDVSQEFVADVVAVSGVDEFETVNIDHEEGGPGVVLLPLPNGRG